MALNLPRRVSVLGSTGSVGVSTLDLFEQAFGFQDGFDTLARLETVEADQICRDQAVGGLDDATNRRLALADVAAEDAPDVEAQQRHLPFAADRLRDEAFSAALDA